MVLMRRMIGVMAATAILAGLVAFWRRRHNPALRTGKIRP